MFSEYRVMRHYVRQPHCLDAVVYCKGHNTTHSPQLNEHVRGLWFLILAPAVIQALKVLDSPCKRG